MSATAINQQFSSYSKSFSFQLNNYYSHSGVVGLDKILKDKKNKIKIKLIKETKQKEKTGEAAFSTVIPLQTLHVALQQLQRLSDEQAK